MLTERVWCLLGLTIENSRLEPGLEDLLGEAEQILMDEGDEAAPLRRDLRWARREIERWERAEQDGEE